MPGSVRVAQQGHAYPADDWGAFRSNVVRIIAANSMTVNGLWIKVTPGSISPFRSTSSRV